MKKIIVALSGGVDSAICAYLLKTQGYEVEGVFLQTWDPSINNEDNMKSELEDCGSKKDYQSAKQVAEFLGIKLHFLEKIESYWNNVFQPFIQDYKNNLTPNPDILCNKYIKFGVLIDEIENKFHPDLIAFGHYASLIKRNNQNYLKLAIDKSKDQTYFLSQLTSQQLNKIVFPLENMTKLQVRQLASQINLPNATRPDSVGICFIGERNMDKFLDNYISPKTGTIVDIVTKKVVGKHTGFHKFTLGQNKNLGLGGMREKMFVCAKDSNKNIVYVCGESYKQTYLSVDEIHLSDLNLLSDIELNQKLEIKYRHSPETVTAKFTSKEPFKLSLENTQIGIAPGQYVAIYLDGLCYGGGKIKEVYANKILQYKI